MAQLRDVTEARKFTEQQKRIK